MQQNVDMHESAAAPLGSFPAIFSQALSLGLLSKRRVYEEARQVLSTEQGPLKSLLGRLSCFPDVSPSAITNQSHLESGQELASVWMI